MRLMVAGYSSVYEGASTLVYMRSVAVPSGAHAPSRQSVLVGDILGGGRSVEHLSSQFSVECGRRGHSYLRTCLESFMRREVMRGCMDGACSSEVVEGTGRRLR